jgi:hypothetical protein
MRVIQRAARSRQTAHADPTAMAEMIMEMASVFGATDNGARVKMAKMTPSPKPPTKYRNELFAEPDTVCVEKPRCASGCPTPA